MNLIMKTAENVQRVSVKPGGNDVSTYLIISLIAISNLTTSKSPGLSILMVIALSFPYRCEDKNPVFTSSGS